MFSITCEKKKYRYLFYKIKEQEGGTDLPGVGVVGWHLRWRGKR
jgi:hypothetical protein